MIESAIINALAVDPALRDLLSTYGPEASPAIFSGMAPEDAALPYVVLTIGRSEPEGPIQGFRFQLDIFDSDKSAANVRAAAERIEFLLDECRLEHPRYSDIRIRMGDVEDVGGDDPRDIHINMQFSARATRTKWMVQTKEAV